MKILHVTGTLDKKNGGVYSAITSLMLMENNLGFSNEVLSTVSPDSEYDNEYFAQRKHLYKQTFPKRFRFSKEAISWLKDNIENYTVVIVHEIWGGIGIQACLIAKRKGIKYIVWPHGSLDPIDLRKKRLLKVAVGNLLLGKIFKHAEAICCTSGMEKQVLQTFNAKPKKVEVLSLPVNFNLVGNKTEFRRIYNISNNDFVFLFLSRITAGKGLDMFLIALKKFLNIHCNYNVKVIIAGFGSQNKIYEEYIKSLIETLGIEKNVVLCGFLSGLDKADAFAAADCFILPSRKENFGISVVEALQTGLPVLISNNVFIWKEIIPNGGRLCEYDVESLNTSIETAYNDTKGNLNSKTPKDVGDKFRSENLMKDYADFYKGLITA